MQVAIFAVIPVIEDLQFQRQIAYQAHSSHHSTNDMTIILHTNFLDILYEYSYQVHKQKSFEYSDCSNKPMLEYHYIQQPLSENYNIFGMSAQMLSQPSNLGT